MAYRLRVREVRTAKGISLYALQRDTGLPTGTIRKLDRAPEGYYPNMKTLLDVARVLGVTLNDLYYDDGEPPETSPQDNSENVSDR